MTIHKILIAVDDSRYAENAAEFGFDMARVYKAEVGLVSIVEPMMFPVAGTDTITGFPVETANTNEMELMQLQSDSAGKIIEQTTKKFGEGLNVTHFTEYGSSADGIIHCGREFNADIIVLGTHSRTGLDRLLMGSVAEHVVRHSTIPVMVVPLRETESQ
jgi:nucleotide-binding universal stress UspA family protein